MEYFDSISGENVADGAEVPIRKYFDQFFFNNFSPCQRNQAIRKKERKVNRWKSASIIPPHNAHPRDTIFQT